MVLVAVVFVVALLGVLVLQFNYLIRLDAKMASHYRDNLQAYYLAKAGVSQAIVLLEDDLLSDKVEENEETAGEEGTKPRKKAEGETGAGAEGKEAGGDDLEEDWAQPQEPVKLGAGEFIFKIVDEDRKFNLNLLVEEAVEKVQTARAGEGQSGSTEEEPAPEAEGDKDKKDTGEKSTKGEEKEKEDKAKDEGEEEKETKVNEEMEEALDRLLDELGVSNPGEMVKNIIDWIDNDDDGKAESDYYSGLDPGYTCKNAPFENIGELALIRDVDRELYRGESSREKIEVIQDEADYLYPREDEGFPGLRHYLTVYSDGKVNVNTATEEVLEVMLGEDYEDLADGIIKVREELIAENEHAFRQVNEIPGALEKDIPSKVLERFKVNSQFFTILSEGKVGNTTARIRVVVQRLEDRVKILYWRFEGS